MCFIIMGLIPQPDEPYDLCSEGKVTRFCCRIFKKILLLFDIGFKSSDYGEW
jgi:hypothetical protein